MKNRKYYSSYGQALKRLNLLTKEVNRLTENEEGTSLFGEQKKFVLKTPKSDEMDEPEMATPPPAEPPAVPSPELPPSPEAEPPVGDMGGDEMPMDDMGDEEMPSDDMDTEETPEPSSDEVSFKSIQKLTGKLTQKMRDFDNEKGLTSENIKYVINMVLSAADLSSLSEEDKEDILSKFESDEEMDFEPEGEDEDIVDMGMEPEGEETTNPEAIETRHSKYGSILDSIFGESKIDKVISRYFEVGTEEKQKIKESKIERQHNNKVIVEGKMKSVVSLCETIEQEWSAKKFLTKNPNFTFVGKTNKNNLVFENTDKQIKITPSGNII
jgi:hypothetical protein